MFGWLADLLLKSSVVGSSCPCCEGQKAKLKKMQQAVLDGSIDYNEESEEHQCCHYDCHCKEAEDCHCHNDLEQEAEMKMTYHYHID